MVKRFRKTRPPGDITVDDIRTKKKEISREVSAFKDPRQLPVLPLEASQQIISNMHRGDDLTRSEIHKEMEQTIPEPLIEEEKINIEGKELEVGVEIKKQRDIDDEGSTKKIIETFRIVEKLSGKANIAGDVWRAERYWGDRFYGEVVLKTPKKRHLENGSAAKLARIYRDMNEEEEHLKRFDHSNILTASGKGFLYNSQPIIQLEYYQWSIPEYLLFQKHEQELTGALMSAAIQSLDVISYLANFKDEMAPNGYVHVDFKRDHMRLQYLEAEDKWMVTVIDLDSIVPAGHIRFRGSKYNPCVDPEKFVKLHNPNILITAEPSETIYSLGLSLLYAISTRFRIRVDKRKFDTEGLTERDGRMIVLDEDAFLKKILNARMTDEMNLVRVYLANKYRRIMAGKVDRDPEEMKELLDEYADMPEIIGAKKEAIRELREVNIDSTVHPNVFVGILECIKPYSERFGPEAMLKRFEYLWNEYLGSEKYSE